jgi:hypothetical protein
MAEDKKPKIDLKARLGKAAGGPAPPSPTAGIPVPAVPTGAPTGGGGGGLASVPTASPSGGALPASPGIPVGPPPAFGNGPQVALDSTNPLAGAAAPYRAPAPAPALPAPQRIEVDELAVLEARKGARKQGLIGGLVVAVVLACKACGLF